MNNKTYENLVNDNLFVTKTNIDGVITHANKNYCEISEFTQNELIGSSYSIVMDIDISTAFYKEMWNTLLSNKTWKGIVKNNSKNSKEFFIEFSIYPIIDENNRIIEFISCGTNVTEHMNTLKYDKLTKLKNRDALKTAIIKDEKYICIVLNIDDFSAINEFYGGVYGDKVLINTAQRLRTVFEGCDIYRLQADEFLILKLLDKSYNISEHGDIMKYKLHSIIEEEYVLDDMSIHITSTCGISIGSQECLRNANLALKNAKLNNKRYSVYNDEMLKKFANFTKNKKIASDIKLAIKDNKITPYYQPIIDNKTGKVAKYEALARLVTVDKIIPPGAFIDVSKKIKYYNEITRAMLKKAFIDFAGNKKVGVSINLTMDDISNLRTFKLITEMLTKNSSNENITFELVETDRIEDYEIFDMFVKTIRGFGAKISIDDFGTGYSNFTYLSNIEPDYLKIDGSLIKNIEKSKDYDVVKTIINFAKMYNIKTIAEFVENEEIYLLVKKLGIDYSQGYYFSKPLAFEELKEEY